MSLFRNEFVGVIVKDEIKGVEVVEEDEKHVKVKNLVLVKYGEIFY